ncbi:MAG TPA: isocitrate lyase/phosphoenolpyruvate mutase family protein [Thermoplasmata archaeon]|nr:isocitrate lyase/phosphoenolpyruvate mutase family protein [Thermoplasmata archaeon]
MTVGSSQRAKANRFRALHHTDRLLVLPNAWDVPSARVFEDAGFPAIATSSAALAASLGYPDGERIPKKELFSVIRRIAGVLQVPLSVDAESGYGESLDHLKATVRGLIAAGAVGLNIEDTVRAEGRSLRPVREQIARLRTIREVADSQGVPVVLNARTDAYTVGTRGASARLDEAIQRGKAYEAAGADCLYPMGLVDRESISTFVKAVKAPVNVMIRKGLPSVAELERIGVRRLSLGPAAMYATMGLLRRAGHELREKGTYESLTTGAISFDELMALAAPADR